ncbi:Ubiquitin carboxyl-terminal hydrolase 30 [Podochytrium sp. JEL0797]|nr:Ubiquitin carboxyl-terminal hydrolase 30 [Podochytrium sp. JEL0797]
MAQRRTAPTTDPSDPSVLFLQMSAVSVSVVLVVSVAWLYSYATETPNASKRTVERRQKLCVKPFKGSKSDAFYPPGLYNLGNTCFMNSVVQALASLPSTVTYLKDRCTVYYSPNVPMPADGSEKKPLYVTEAMLDLALALNEMGTSRRTLKPGNLMQALEAVKKSNRKLLCYEQQDAHELLALVSGHLTDEELPRPPTTVSLFDLASIQDSNRSQIVPAESASLISSSSNEHSIHPHHLKNPLTGLMAGIMTCTRCGYKSAINCAVFNNISLAVPAVAQVSIEQLLQTYITPEPIHDYVCDKCSLFATARTIESKAIQIKLEIEALKQGSLASNVSSPVPVAHSPTSTDPASTSSSKKKKKKKKPSVVESTMEAEIKPTTPVPVDSAQMRQLVATAAQLEQDRQLVLEAAKFNVEAKLPKHIKLTKSVSPLTTKQIVIATPPRSLCFHMQRSVFLPSGHSYKNNSRVLFGEFLDISKFCLNSSSTDGRPNGAGTGWADLMMANANHVAGSLQQVNDEDEEAVDEMGGPPPLSVVEEPSEHKKGGLVGGSDRFGTSYSSVLANLASQSGSGGAAASYSGVEGSPYPYLYRLHAVVIHYGSHDSGHFVTYRRCPHPLSKEFMAMGLSGDDDDGPEKSESKVRRRRAKVSKKEEAAEDGSGADVPARWFRISDERVDLVRNVHEEVYVHASQHAYMLFYERVGGKVE